MTLFVRRIVLFLATIAFAAVSAQAQLKELGDGGPGPIKAPHLTAEMVSLSPNVAPGGSVYVGLVITLDEKWHVYWANAGDSRLGKMVVISQRGNAGAVVTARSLLSTLMGRVSG